MSAQEGLLGQCKRNTLGDGNVSEKHILHSMASADCRQMKAFGPYLLNELIGLFALEDPKTRIKTVFELPFIVRKHALDCQAVCK